jgi:hypothetical protein
MDYEPYRNPLSTREIARRGRRTAVGMLIFSTVLIGSGLGADEPIVSLAGFVILFLAVLIYP